MGHPRATVLRGRETELAVVASALRDLDSGRGGMLIVEGPPGIGKTALLAEAGAMARQRGARALLAEALESQQTVPFAPLLAALSTVLPSDTARHLEDAADARYRVLHDLQAALETAAARSPLVIGVDDLPWANNATLVALASLVPALTELPILWLATARTGHRRRAVTELATRLERAGAVRLRLGGLAPDAVVAVTADFADAEADTALTALVDRADGNPFVLTELLHGLREEGRLRVDRGRATATGAALPRRLTASMADRLAALPADAERVVRVAAALPPRFSAAHLAAVLRLPPPTLMAPLEEALRADLLAEAGDQLRFRHDVLRQAVLETMARSLRRALQRDAVDVLLREGVAAGEVATQLARSAEPGDRTAVATLRRAARGIAGSDPAAAAELSVRALELLPPDDADRGLVTAETVALMHRARRSAEAQALADRVLAGVLPPNDEAEVRLSVSRMMTRSTVARAHDNRRALALPDLTPVVRGRHLAWLAYNLAGSGEPVPATTAAEAALREGQVTADAETRVIAGLALACAESAGGAYSAALRRIEDLRVLLPVDDRTLPAAVLAVHHAHVLAVLGRLDEARTMVVDGVVAARHQHDAPVLTAWTQFGGLLSLAAGELSDARAAVASALPADDEPVADSFAGIVRMVAMSELGTHLGDAALLRAGRAAARTAGADSGPAVRRLANRLLARTTTGPGSAARAVRLLADDPLVPATPLVPGDLGYHPWVARVACTAGATDLARRAAAAADSLHRQNSGVSLFEGLAAHTRGLVAGDPALLAEGARLLGRTHRPLLAAAADEDAGRSLADLHRPSAAIEHFNAAFDMYAAHGATADARRVGRLLRGHGVSRGAPRTGRQELGFASLTDSELQVVRIVAGGATNRTAAEQLFLSPHTVSSHLRSAFTKLGINSRVQLALVLRERES